MNKKDSTFPLRRVWRNFLERSRHTRIGKTDTQGRLRQAKILNVNELYYRRSLTHFTNKNSIPLRLQWLVIFGRESTADSELISHSVFVVFLELGSPELGCVIESRVDTLSNRRYDPRVHFSFLIFLAWVQNKTGQVKAVHLLILIVFCLNVPPQPVIQRKDFLGRTLILSAWKLKLGFYNHDKVGQRKLLNLFFC